MYNKVTLMGRICHDLELKTTASGIFVLSFRLAVERNYKPKNKEKKTDFLNMVAWRGTAEFIHKYFSKGRLILIEGEIQTRQYTDKDNFTRTITEIVVSNTSFTGEPKLQATPQTTTQAMPQSDNFNNQQTDLQEDIQIEIEYTDEDYPF